MNSDATFAELATLCPLALIALEKGSICFISSEARKLFALDIPPLSQPDDTFHDREIDSFSDDYGLLFSDFFKDHRSYNDFCSRFLQQLNVEKSISGIYPLKRRDGEFLLAGITARAIQHEYADTVIAIEDITGQEEEYAELRYRCAQLFHDLDLCRNSCRQVLDSVNMGIIILRPDATILEVNPYMEKKLGKGWTGEKCFKMCVKFWSSEDQSTLCPFCRMPEVVNTGRPAREFITDRQGNHWIFTWAPVKDSTGKVTAIVKVVADLTPEVKSKERIALQEELLTRIVEIIPAGILIIDESGRVEYTNRTFARRWGLDKSALFGMDLGNLNIYDNQGFVNRILSAMVSGRVLENIEYMCEGDNDSFQVFTCNFYPLNLSDGRCRGLLVEVDRTDDVMQQRETEALVSSLDREIKEKNVTITEQKKLASVGRLAAGITHELNTPTTYIRGNLQLFDKYALQLQEEIGKLADHGLSGDSAEIGRRMEDILSNMRNFGRFAFLGTERIMNIISSMRGFVKHEAGRKKKINLYEPLRDALVLVFNRIKQYGSITINGWTFRPEDTGRFIASHSINIFGSSQRLCQLFVNLVNNSIDAWNDSVEKRTARERLVLDITVVLKGSRVHVMFCDNAGGMPEDVEQKVFEPFFTTRASRKGTGLGLNIVFQIVKEHSGKITLENDYGKGVCWYISLPRLDKDMSI